MSVADTSIRLDTLLRVTTAEATDITLRPAGMIARSLALLLDLVVCTTWLFITGIMFLKMLLQSFGDVWVIGLYLLNVFLMFWLYPVLFEVFWHGQTPGKRVFRLRVCADNGAPVSWSASLLRNLLRLVDTLPLFYAVGICVSLFHPQGKRLGDMLAGTLVVYAAPARRQTDWSILSGIEPVQPPVVLKREEQQALLTFAERQQYLPASRRRELAAAGAYALYGSSLPQPDAMALILGMAKFLLGDASELYQPRRHQ